MVQQLTLKIILKNDGDVIAGDADVCVAESRDLRVSPLKMRLRSSRVSCVFVIFAAIVVMSQPHEVCCGISVRNDPSNVL